MAGEAVAPRGVETRRVRGVIELGRPAPLLIRLMRKKSTLEGVGRTRVPGRPANEARERGPTVAEEVRGALAERAVPDRQLPGPELRAGSPRGFAVSRLGGEP